MYSNRSEWLVYAVVYDLVVERALDAKVTYPGRLTPP